MVVVAQVLAVVGGADPPTASTPMRGRYVAVNSWRGKCMVAAAVHVPVPGWYSSAVAKSVVFRNPPATRTLPSCRRVAVWATRPSLMDDVGVHRPVAGSNTSTLDRAVK